MSENKNSCGCVKGVGCDVKNCKYHDGTEDYCTAEHIVVENKTALSKAETYCNTFSPKSSL